VTIEFGDREGASETTRSTSSSPSARCVIRSTLYSRAAEKTSATSSLAVCGSRCAVGYRGGLRHGAPEHRPRRMSVHRRAVGGEPPAG
jgi:hypothetical protein